MIPTAPDDRGRSRREAASRDERDLRAMRRVIERTIDRIPMLVDSNPEMPSPSQPFWREGLKQERNAAVFSNPSDEGCRLGPKTAEYV
jgi:hypothetical protein